MSSITSSSSGAAGGATTTMTATNMRERSQYYYTQNNVSGSVLPQLPSFDLSEESSSGGGGLEEATALGLTSEPMKQFVLAQIESRKK